MSITRCAAVAALVLLTAGGASAQPAPKAGSAPAAEEPSRMDEARKVGTEIVTQPARDVGISKTEVPPVLQKAGEAPYGVKDVKTCKQLATAVKQLNEALGPDLAGGEAKPENRVGKLAEAGGKTVVNTFLPFRSLVREVSGAAPSERRLAAAVSAGYARRGFLRGIYTTRNCRPKM
jgi:hypothetical protein